ncbi:MAG: DUF1743 domain-containing protein [Thaumarchaeota archaeon]|nr:DUF1743 domain-containing protein [Nitrososphaerota archaeon]
MNYLVGLDDTDSSLGGCTTYLAYRLATDLGDCLTVLPHPRLVRLNPNIPFKTRGNAAVCLPIETDDPDVAFERICAKVSELSQSDDGANSGVVFLPSGNGGVLLERLYRSALSGVVNVHRVRGLLKELGAKTMTTGNGMGLVGAASSLAFDERYDHTFELISYRVREMWGSRRTIDASSVRRMDLKTFPSTFNNYDYQKRKVLVAPHGPDPVFAGVRGESPSAVAEGFESLVFEEDLDGYMVYLTNQYTDAHIAGEVSWKTFSSGWVDGRVSSVGTGAGGHVYVLLETPSGRRPCAFYEPTGDLRRAAAMLETGDSVRVSGGVRKPSKSHPSILNAEKLEVLSLSGAGRRLVKGTYASSPRSNRHLTKPLIRYGRENPGMPADSRAGWLRTFPTPSQVPVRSPSRDPPRLRYRRTP